MRRSFSNGKNTKHQFLSKINLNSSKADPFLPLKKKETCHICHKHFRLYRKRQTCSKCNLPVCAEHSGGIHNKEKTRVCDECVRDSLYDKTFLTYAPEKESLLRQFETLEKKNDQEKSLVRRIKTQIKDIEESLNFKLEKKKEFEIYFKEKIEEEEKRNILESEKLDNFERLFGYENSAEEEYEKKSKEKVEEVEFLRREFEILQKEYGECEELYTQRKDLISGKIEFDIIRKNLCRKCYRKFNYMIAIEKERKFSVDGQECKICCLIF